MIHDCHRNKLFFLNVLHQNEMVGKENLLSPQPPQQIPRSQNSLTSKRVFVSNQHQENGATFFFILLSHMGMIVIITLDKIIREKKTQNIPG